MRGAAVLASLLAHVAVSSAGRLPQAVVINMPKHEKRMAGVKQELDAAGIEFERMDAVEGKKLLPAERRQNVTALARLFITPGMMGCFLSHRQCWQRCAELGQDLMVFEDDIYLGAEFQQKLLAAMDDLPPDWDVLLLGALGLVHPERKYGLWWLLHFLPSVFFLPWSGMRWKPRISQSVHVPLRPAGTHAYVVSPAGARKLLDACPRASYHVDVVAWGTEGLQLFCINPLLAKQTHEDTTIGGRRDFETVRRLLQWLGVSLVFDRYTGADLAWAYNTPLFRIGGDHWYVLMSTGRCTSLWGVGAIVSALLRSKMLLAANTLLLAIQVAIVRLLTASLGQLAAPPAAPKPVDI